MFKLNELKAQRLQLSNDAFYFLVYGEECLDDDNLEEAKEIQALFPDGFEVDLNWMPVEGSDMIEATFIPYEKEIETYDLVQDLCQGVQLRLKWLNYEQSKARVVWHDFRTNMPEHYGDFDIWETKPGLKCFNKGDWKTGHGSLFFLKHFHTPSSLSESSVRSNR